MFQRVLHDRGPFLGQGLEGLNRFDHRRLLLSPGFFLLPAKVARTTHSQMPQRLGRLHAAAAAGLIHLGNHLLLEFARQLPVVLQT